MNKKLISGYATYTSPAEFGGTPSGDAPASTPTIVTGVSVVALTVASFC